MSVLSWQKHEIAENTESLLSEGAANRARARITAATLRNSPSLPRVREEKILAIRQQLARGTYDLDRRLNAAVHRLLAVVTT
jgi:anti-sigma28 factor (negative regulator of flagellin synthesis)